MKEGLLARNCATALRKQNLNRQVVDGAASFSTVSGNSKLKRKLKRQRPRLEPRVDTKPLDKSWSIEPFQAKTLYQRTNQANDKLAGADDYPPCALPQGLGEVKTLYQRAAPARKKKDAESSEYTTSVPPRTPLPGPRASPKLKRKSQTKKGADTPKAAAVTAAVAATKSIVHAPGPNSPEQKSPNKSPLELVYGTPTVISTVREAEDFLAQVKASPQNAKYGCDTEVKIDIKEQSPVENGKVTCVSIYVGRDGGCAERAWWVDVLDGESGVLEAIKPFLEAQGVSKIWHNYSFDRHCLYNHGINCQGFGGDTMHMARLLDSSLDALGGGGGYSLAALSKKFLGKRGDDMTKTSMKELFGVPAILKSGKESKIKVLPPVPDIQRSSKSREDWIKYSCVDAMVTAELYHKLRQDLERQPWQPLEALGSDVPRPNQAPVTGSLWDLYEQRVLPFGEVLTEMERVGVQIDSNHLEQAQGEAEQEVDRLLAHFRDWTLGCGAFDSEEDAHEFNPGSTAQKQFLLFADNYVLRHKDFPRAALPEGHPRRPRNAASGALNKKILEHQKKEKKLAQKLRKAEEDDDQAQAFDLGEKLAKVSSALSTLLNEKQQKQAKLDSEPPVLTPEQEAKWTKEAKFKVPNTIGYIAPGRTKPLATRDVRIRGLGIPPIEYTPSGWPTAGGAVFAALAGRDPESGQFGTALDALGGTKKKATTQERQRAEDACHAFNAVNKATTVEKLLSTFIVPLQRRVDSQGRLHTSINLNTETGRLSSRNPNLQNQPALEKDLYKIRKAFVAKQGNKLIVADYGQLELRVLAHLANCSSMIDAFEKGGDFHSRTAMGMYPEIKQEMESGKVLLEWDSVANGGQPPPVPLIKNKYGSERRQAKVLNFSIAYGKTAHGLSKDFGVDLEEAKNIVDRWYADRVEVQEWQEAMRHEAKTFGRVRTLWGRTRLLPNAANFDNKIARSGAMRAAINTPIQGSAADIVMAAMLKVSRNQRLNQLGWQMILQVHDEIIMEGPEESADEAMQLLVQDMEDPLDFRLKVDLIVDADIAGTWYDAK